MKQFLYITILAVLISSCQNPRLLKTNNAEEICPIFTEGVNFQHHNYLNENMPLPIIFEKDESLSGMPTQTLCFIRDQIVLTTHNGHLYIINSNNFGKNSKTKISRAISAPPTFHNGFLYIAAEIGKEGLSAYDIYKGETVWRQKGYMSVSSPIVSQDRVFHGALNGAVICLNAADGQKIWESATGDKITSSLAFKDNNLIAASQNGIIRNYNASSGTTNWSLELNEGVFTHPLIVDNRIFIVTYPGNLYSIDLKNGKIITKKPFGVKLYTAPSTDRQSLFIPLSDGKIAAINLDTYKTQWTIQLEGPPSAPILVTNNALFAGTAQKHFYVIDKKNGEIIQKIKLEGRLKSLPVILNEKLFLSYEYKYIASFIVNKEEKDAAE
jgi:outer membrane protein assembly factor BamB